MKVNYNYLKDADFKKYVDQLKIKEQYVKITILDWEENPIQEIQGIVTGGSLNLDGASNIRRTCNLSAFVNSEEYANIENVDNLFSINKKIYLEIGYKNETLYYTEYPFIWYPQGVFVMTGVSSSHSTSGTNLSLQLKDKMCLLNGEVGGIIPASTQFDQYETIDENGEWIVQKPIIEQIIRETVNHFGKEQLGKIIIEDLDNKVKNVMKWTGNTPVYLINNDNSWIFSTNKNDTMGRTFKEYSYGEDIGYIYTDFYYPAELIGNAGSTVTSILDNIKTALGNYEYFYDVDGNFRFREIKNYLNTTKTTADLNHMTNNDYLLDAENGKSVYQFDDSLLINSYSNAPQYNKIKNDFIVWGIKENENGNKVPIRYHLSIDKKPKSGHFYKGFFYDDPDDGLKKIKVPIPAKNLSELQKNKGVVGLFYLTQDDNQVYKWDGKTYIAIEVELVNIQANDWRSELYLQGTQAEPLAIKSNDYYAELLNEWPKIYNLQAKNIINNKENFYQGDFYEEVLKTPSKIDYYLDFIDSSAEISQFNISNIGKRSLVITDNSINCIFEPDIPDFILIEKGKEDTEEKRLECIKRGQNYIQVDENVYSMLALGGTKNSAYNKVRELLYQYTSYNESISIQSIPIFHLEPNTRITVEDIESNIFGDYIISNISIPLVISGTMSISAIRALNRI